jgi:hypothetical protein
LAVKSLDPAVDELYGDELQNDAHQNIPLAGVSCGIGALREAMKSPVIICA